MKIVKCYKLRVELLTASWQSLWYTFCAPIINRLAWCNYKIKKVFSWKEWTVTYAFHKLDGSTAGNSCPWHFPHGHTDTVRIRGGRSNDTRGMPDKVCKKVALRVAFFPLSSKTWEGVNTPPPPPSGYALIKLFKMTIKLGFFHLLCLLMSRFDMPFAMACFIS